MRQKQLISVYVSLITLLTFVVIINIDEHDTSNRLDKQIVAISGKIPYGIESVKVPDLSVTVTAYSPTERECDSDPFITAFQKRVREGTIAISRDLEKELGLKPGDMVHLDGLGAYEVHDRMNRRWSKRVDIFFYDSEKAVSFGVKEAKVLKVEKRPREDA